jgi:hypothetical protein
MAYTAESVEYFYATVSGEHGEAYELLESLANLGINFRALSSTHLGPRSIQLTLFPDDPARLKNVAKAAGMALDGPHSALLVQGDDEMGALARIHHELREGNVDVYASSAVTDGKGYYGYIIYLRPHDAEKAARILAAHSRV